MFFNLHTHNRKKNNGEIALVNCYPNDDVDGLSYYSCGIHPWYFSKESKHHDLLTIENRLRDSNCLALGECGLDKRIDIDLKSQTEVLIEQIVLAKQFAKPVVVHCVGAFAEVQAVLKKCDFRLPVIFHGYSKQLSLAEQLQKAGFFLSFGKYLMTTPHLPDVLKHLNLRQVFLETDSSNFSISEVYQLAAASLKMEVSNLKYELNLNVNNVFKISI